MNEHIIYPDTSVLPEKCRECPGISSMLLAWNVYHGFTDRLIRAAIDPTLDREQIIEKGAAALPVEMVELVNTATGSSLDSDLEADRKTAIRMLTDIDGPVYNDAKEQIAEVEEALQKTTGDCEQKGPLEVRVPTKHAHAIVAICRADIEASRPGHDHVTPVFIRRESK
jgi:hypothetical protein